MSFIERLFWSCITGMIMVVATATIIGTQNDWDLLLLSTAIVGSIIFIGLLSIWLLRGNVRARNLESLEGFLDAFLSIPELQAKITRLRNKAEIRKESELPAIDHLGNVDGALLQWMEAAEESRLELSETEEELQKILQKYLLDVIKHGGISREVALAFIQKFDVHTSNFGEKTKKFLEEEETESHE